MAGRNIIVALASVLAQAAPAILNPEKSAWGTKAKMCLSVSVLMQEPDVLLEQTHHKSWGAHKEG